MTPRELLRSARRRVGRAIRNFNVPKQVVERTIGGKIERIECYKNHGVVLPIVPSITSEAIAGTIRSGWYEGHEAALLDGLIQQDEIILEVGAGCGFISTLCAKNPRTRSIHCVEANPNLIDIIRLTHSLNGVDVVVYNEILAKEDGETDFYVHPDFWASGIHSFLGSPIKVRTKSFQARLDEIRPTMLIVDIEGGEATLFDDVELTTVRKIMVELHQPTIGRAGMKKVFDKLSKQNFHYDMGHSTHSVVTFWHVDQN